MVLDTEVDNDNNLRPLRIMATWFRDESCKDVIYESQHETIKSLPSFKMVQKKIGLSIILKNGKLRTLVTTTQG